MNQETVPYTDHRLKFDYTPEQLGQLGEEIVAAHKAVEDKLANTPIENWTKATLYELLDANMDFSTCYGNCYFPVYASPDKDLREKATEVKKKVDAYCVESSMREDMFQILKKFQEKVNADSNKLGLTTEELRFLDKEINDYKRSGLDLPAEQKKRVEEIEKQLSELKTKFSKNCNEDVTKEAFSKEQLEGLGEDYFQQLKKTEDGEKYYVTMKYPDVLPLMDKCKVEATRKRIDYLRSTVGGPENPGYLEEAVKLRYEKAKILGYDTFSDFILEIRMAKKKETVLNFIQDLRNKLVPFAQKELEVLRQLKEKDCKERGIEFDGKVNSWDLKYYENILLDTEYQLDHDKIKEYFPIDKVTQGMFEIYQQILQVRFEKLENFRTWHEDVKCFSVYDSKTNNFMGHFYLDMYPRDGKYGHACAIGLQRSGNRGDGTRQYPACVMLCNFTKPTDTKPSLLQHSEVETFFHEFGHVMHNICTEATIHRFSCTQVERDFVEAPSQMLENWTYEEKPLNIMSGHYQDLSKTLPKEYLESIIKARNVNTGILNLRQLFFGTFDMTIHTSKEPVDTKTLWAKIRKEVSLIEQQPGTNPSGNFGHLMGGYESGYYGYLWSQVYSADMYEGGFRGDPLNTEFGYKYRKCILAPGGSKDGMQLIIDFLGREPVQDSFLVNIGVQERKPKL